MIFIERGLFSLFCMSIWQLVSSSASDLSPKLGMPLRVLTIFLSASALSLAAFFSAFACNLSASTWAAAILSCSFLSSLAAACSSVSKIAAIIPMANSTAKTIPIHFKVFFHNNLLILVETIIKYIMSHGVNLAIAVIN